MPEETKPTVDAQPPTGDTQTTPGAQPPAETTSPAGDQQPPTGDPQPGKPGKGKPAPAAPPATFVRDHPPAPVVKIDFSGTAGKPFAAYGPVGPRGSHVLIAGRQVRATAWTKDVVVKGTVPEDLSGEVEVVINGVAFKAKV